MRLRAVLPAICSFAFLLAAGCDRMPGYPKARELARPEDQMDFATLYKTNCQGCHGADGQNGVAMDLANPEYQALVDDATLKRTITGGQAGSRMPGFARSAGAALTGEQIDAIVKGMRAAWRKPGAFGADTPPAYAAAEGERGDAARGRQLYGTFCSSCHTRSPDQQVTSPTYLALVSDQALRTIIIAGRPDLGHPDWRNDQPGHPLSEQDVTDIVTYLGSLRSGATTTPPAQHERGEE